MALCVPQLYPKSSDVEVAQDTLPEGTLWQIFVRANVVIVGKLLRAHLFTYGATEALEKSRVP